MKNLLHDISGAIGETPLVELKRFTGFLGLSGRIYAKLEHLNPGYSKKDRIAVSIIEDAQNKGILKKGQKVVEATSGNTGIGLAIACLIKGYPFTAVMSRGNSEERSKILGMLGAEVVLIDQEEGAAAGQVTGGDLKRVDEAARKIAKENGGFFADQFNNAANSQAQEEIAKEIWVQCGGKLDAFLDFAGTGGTYAGCTKVFKEKNPAIKCFIVEPAKAAFLSDGEIKDAKHKLQGGGYGMALPLLVNAPVDGYIKADDEESIKMVRLLAKTEGILAGFSSGANLAAAVSLLKGAQKGRTVAIIINDTALKYLSTDLLPE